MVGLSAMLFLYNDNCVNNLYHLKVKGSIIANFQVKISGKSYCLKINLKSWLLLLTFGGDASIVNTRWRGNALSHQVFTAKLIVDLEALT